MATKKSEKIIKSPVCRISYPNVFKKQEFEDGKSQYNLVMLIPKTEGVEKWKRDPKLKPMIKALKAAAMEKWNKLPKKLKLPFKDGDKSVGVDGEGPDDAYKGMWVVACSSDHQPGIVAADAQKYLTEEKDFYAGCWAYVSLNGFAWTNQYKKSGCSFGLRNIQKIKDGKRLGGIPSAEDDFDPLEGVDDDDDFDGDDDDDDDTPRSNEGDSDDDF